MTLDQRNSILEAADILKRLGGKNGFSNLQPKIRMLCMKKGHELTEIVENDIQNENPNEQN